MILKSLLGGRLVIETGDITDKAVDAIVNAANSSLMGGGGVDGAIHRRGGHAILEECKKIRATAYPDGLPPGMAVLTGGGDLPASHVIHTVGPVWHGGGKGEPEVLAGAYTSCLAIASGMKMNVIAFPSISTGVYGYPKEKAAVLVYGVIKDFLTSNDKPEKVCLVFFSPDDADIFLSNIR
ncbi:MAG: O-acetyl-ADP-ribose deacetylase [Spirochaetales bacterium]|nr:O-acetyl-ADP-ribose deacetylase [Spirochaetales bacterium]